MLPFSTLKNWSLCHILLCFCNVVINQWHKITFKNNTVYYTMTSQMITSLFFWIFLWRKFLSDKMGKLELLLIVFTHFIAYEHEVIGTTMLLLSKVFNWIKFSHIDSCWITKKIILKVYHKWQEIVIVLLIDLRKLSYTVWWFLTRIYKKEGFPFSAKVSFIISKVLASSKCRFNLLEA